MRDAPDKAAMYEVLVAIEGFPANQRSHATICRTLHALRWIWKPLQRLERSKFVASRPGRGRG
jgi:hypothetical protein